MAGFEDNRRQSETDKELFRIEMVAGAVDALADQRGKPIKDDEVQMIIDLSNEMAEAGRRIGRSALQRRNWRYN